MKRALFDQISKILLGCLNCWNDLDVFKVRECFFTRLGIFPFHEKDAEKISDNLREYCNEHGYQLNEVEEQKQDLKMNTQKSQGLTHSTSMHRPTDVRRTTVKGNQIPM